MAVLEMLSKVVGPEEFLSLITFAEFVDMVKVFSADVPLRRVRELFAAVTAHVCAITISRVERSFDTSKRRTGP